MNFSLISDYYFDQITDITVEFLHDRGITLLLLDLDNTISPYGIDTPKTEILQWVETMKNGGITLFFVSNNRSDRAKNFAEQLEIAYINRAAKPCKKGLIQAMQLTGKKITETALVGDQSYTDVLAANRAGVTSILVQPISLKNPLLALRYGLELPFRGRSRNDCRRK